MANKFFSYSFQVHRTRKAGIIFIVFIIILFGGLFIWYHSKNDMETVDKLKYKKFFGINEFEYNGCSKAYRINYDKKTCGTICINKINIDKNYVKNKKKEMEDNGFTISDIKVKKINRNNWDYIKTTNDGPIIQYYVSNYNKKTYIIEHIDQSDYQSSKIKSNCNKISNKIIKSLDFE